jgi:hypothetical protein
MQPFNTRNWYSYLTDWQQQLVEVTGKLLRQHEDGDNEYLVDYSFLVFSMSKAYEGFLKKFLYDFELIDQETYEGRLFRIGRALNPQIPQGQRDQYWLYDDVIELCSEETADNLWKAWLYCRNRVFHFFPKDKGLLTFNQAVEKIQQVDRAMAAAVQCYNHNNNQRNSN